MNEENKPGYNYNRPLRYEPASLPYGQGDAPRYYESGAYGEGGPEDSGIFGEITPSRLLRVLQRKWFTILFAIAVAVSGGYFYTRQIAPIYQTASLFELYLRRPRIMSKDDAIIDRNAGSQESFNTYFEKLKGPTILNLAFAIVREDRKFAQVTDAELQQDINVNFRVVNQSRLVRVVVEHANPELAAAIANAYIEATIRSTFEENRDATENAVAWLKAQAETMRQTLEKADIELLRFREASEIEPMNNRKQMVEHQLGNTTSQLTSFENQLATEQQVVNFFDTTELKPDNIDKMPSSVAQADLIQESLNAMTAAANERKALLVKYTPQHPKVTAQEQILEELNREFDRAVHGAKIQSKANVEFLKKQTTELRKNAEKLNTELATINLKLVETKMQITALEREREASDVSYRGILNRIEEARLAADENTASIVVIERAGVPRKPLDPGKSRILYMALGGGLFLGLGLAFITDKLEDHIWTTDDVERGLGMKILGLVPHTRSLDRDTLGTICHSQRNSLIAESFAGIRGVITSVYGQENTKSVLVTSSSPSEGKTITATNLSIMYAKAGLRTVLIDLDLRIPRIRRIFKLNTAGKNLMRVLADRDREAFSEIIHATDIENLSVICSQPEKGLSPAEILGSSFVKELIDWARQHFDQVIIDSPPFGAVSDSSVIGSMTDGVILVAREKKSRKAAVRAAMQQFKDCGSTILGTVINDVKYRNGKYGYYSGYSYHHSYYNQYSIEHSRPENTDKKMSA